MTKDNECRRIFPVTGMSCAACATRVEKTIAHTKGVRSAAVNFAASEVTVEYDSDACTPEQLREKTVPAAAAWAPVAERLWSDPEDPEHAKRGDWHEGQAVTDVTRLARVGRDLATEPEPRL